MKQYGKQSLEARRPSKHALETITFCLEQLYKDKKHWLNDEIAKDLTYEEVIGALLQGRDAVEETQTQTLNRAMTLVR